MEERRFQKVRRGYSRSQEKAKFQSVLEAEYYDPQIADPEVAGGDPGIADLMSTGLEAMMAEDRAKMQTGEPPGS